MPGKLACSDVRQLGTNYSYFPSVTNLVSYPARCLYVKPPTYCKEAPLYIHDRSLGTTDVRKGYYVLKLSVESKCWIHIGRRMLKTELPLATRDAKEEVYIRDEDGRADDGSDRERCRGQSEVETDDPLWRSLTRAAESCFNHLPLIYSPHHPFSFFLPFPSPPSHPFPTISTLFTILLPSYLSFSSGLIGRGRKLGETKS